MLALYDACMDLANYPKSQELQKRLNGFRPDMPTCQERASKAIIGSYLANVDEEDSKGRSRMEVLMEAKYLHMLQHPEDINLKELVSAASMEQRASEQTDKGSALADMFKAFGDDPEEVVVAEGEELR